MSYGIGQLSEQLEALTSTEEYKRLKAPEQQDALRIYVQEFSSKNPERAEDFKELANQANEGFLRSQKLGRHIPDAEVFQSTLSDVLPGLGVENGNLKFDEFLGQDERVKVIEEARGKLKEAAKKADYLNAGDTEKYFNDYLTNQRRVVEGEDVGYPRDKAARVVNGFTNSVASVLGKEYKPFSENYKYDQDLIAKLATGAGGIGMDAVLWFGTAGVGAVAARGASIANKARIGANVAKAQIGVSFSANAATKYFEGYKKALDLGLSDEEAVAAGFASAPSAAIDAFADKLLLGRMNLLEPSEAGKVQRALLGASKQKRAEVLVETIKGLPSAKRAVLSAAIKGGAAEALTEAASTYGSGLGGYMATGNKEFIPSEEELLDALLVGGILGGAIGGAATSASGQRINSAQREELEGIGRFSEADQTLLIDKLESGDLKGVSSILRDIKSKDPDEKQEKQEPDRDSDRAVDEQSDRVVFAEIQSLRQDEQDGAGGESQVGVSDENRTVEESLAGSPVGDSLKSESPEAAERIRSLVASYAAAAKGDDKESYKALESEMGDLEVAEAVEQAFGISFDGYRDQIRETGNGNNAAPVLGNLAKLSAEGIIVRNAVPEVPDLDIQIEGGKAYVNVLEKPPEDPGDDSPEGYFGELFNEVYDGYIEEKASDSDLEGYLGGVRSSKDFLKNVQLDAKADLRERKARSPKELSDYDLSLLGKKVVREGEEKFIRDIEDPLSYEQVQSNFSSGETRNAVNRIRFQSRERKRLRKIEANKLLRDRLQSVGNADAPLQEAAAATLASSRRKYRAIKSNNKAADDRKALRELADEAYPSTSPDQLEAEKKKAQEDQDFVDDVNFKAEVARTKSDFIKFDIEQTMGEINQSLPAGSGVNRRSDLVTLTVGYYLDQFANIVSGSPIEKTGSQREVFLDEEFSESKYIKDVLRHLRDNYPSEYTSAVESADAFRNELRDLIGIKRQERSEAKSNEEKRLARNKKRREARAAKKLIAEYDNFLAENKRFKNRSKIKTRKEAFDYVSKVLFDPDGFSATRKEYDGSDPAVELLREKLPDIFNLAAIEANERRILESRGDLKNSHDETSIFQGEVYVGDKKVELESVDVLPSEAFPSFVRMKDESGGDYIISGPKVRDILALKIPFAYEGIYAPANYVIRRSVNYDQDFGEGTMESAISAFARIMPGYDKANIFNDPSNPSDAYVNLDTGVIGLNLARIGTDPKNIEAKIEHELSHVAQLSAGKEIEALLNSLPIEVQQEIDSFVKENYGADEVNEEIISRRFDRVREISNKMRSNRGLWGKLKAAFQNFMKDTFGVGSNTIDSQLDRFIEVGIANLGKVKSPTSGPIRNSLFSQKDIDGFAKSPGPKVEPPIARDEPSIPTGAREVKSALDKLKEIPGYDGFRASSRFIDRFKAPNLEDQKIANAIKRASEYVGVIVNNDLPSSRLVPEFIRISNNFRASRSLSAIKNAEDRIETFGGLMEKIRLISDEMRSDVARYYLASYEDIIDKKYDGDGSLDSVKKWLQEGISSDKAELDVDFANRTLNKINELAEIGADGCLDFYESLHGQMSKGHREILSSHVSKTIQELQEFKGGKNSDYKKVFMVADSLMNGQVMGLRDLIIGRDNRDLIEESYRHKGKFRTALDKFSRYLRLNGAESLDTTIDRFSLWKEQNDFIRKVLESFRVNVMRSENESQIMVDKFSERMVSYHEKMGMKPEETTIDDIYLMMGSQLRQVEVSSDITPDEYFKNTRKKIEASLVNMRRLGKKERALADQVEEVYLDLTKNADSYDQFMASFERRLDYNQDGKGLERVKFLDDVSGMLSESYSSFKFTMEAFHGGKMAKISHFMFTEVVSREAKENETLLEGSSANGFRNINEEIGNVQGERMQDLGKSGGYYNYNMASVIPKKIAAMQFDIYTSADRAGLASLLNNPEFVENIGGPDHINENADLLRKRVVLMIDNSLHKGVNYPGLITAINTIQRQFTKVNLSSFTQFVSQPVAAFTQYAVENAGNFSYMQKSLSILANQHAEVMDFLRENNRTIYDRAIGNQAGGQLELDDASLKVARTSLRAAFKKLDKKSEDILLAPLKKGDAYASQAIFLAEYIKQLELSGQTSFEGKVDFTRPDYKAIKRANSITDKSIGPSSKSERGILFSDRDPILAALRMNFLAYATHMTELGARLQGNLRNLGGLISSRDPEVAALMMRDTAGIIGQMITFSASKFAVNAAISFAVLEIARNVIDEDEDDELRLREEIRLEDDPNRKMMLKEQLAYTLSVKKNIQKQIRAKQSGEAFWNTLASDTLSGLHLTTFVGESFLPKMIINQFSKGNKDAYNELKGERISRLRERREEAKSIGDMKRVDRIDRMIDDLENIEFMPLMKEYPDTNPFGGVFGMTADAFKKPANMVGDLVLPAAMGDDPLRNYGLEDFGLLASGFGAGQSDLNKYFRFMSKVNKEKFEIENRFKKKREDAAKEQASEEARQRAILEALKL